MKGKGTSLIDWKIEIENWIEFEIEIELKIEKLKIEFNWNWIELKINWLKIENWN